jgi:hypothetical protein
MESIRLDHVDFPAQKILEVHLEGPEVDPRGSWAKLYEEIDIARGICLAARERAENLEATCLVPSRKGENLLPFCLEERGIDETFVDGHGLNLTPHDTSEASGAWTFWGIYFEIMPTIVSHVSTSCGAIT